MDINDPLDPRYDPNPPSHEYSLPPAFEFDDDDYEPYDPMYDVDDYEPPVYPLPVRLWRKFVYLPLWRAYLRIAPRLRPSYYAKCPSCGERFHEKETGSSGAKCCSFCNVPF